MAVIISASRFRITIIKKGKQMNVVQWIRKRVKELEERSGW